MKSALRSIFAVLGLFLVCLQAPWAQAHTLFRLPFGTYTKITNFYDRDQILGKALDWKGCTSLTTATCARDKHKGTDFGIAEKTPIVAAAAGTVVWSVIGCPNDTTQPGCGSSYGNHVRLRHGSATSYDKASIYAHMIWDKNNTYPIALEPAAVKCGATIGYAGKSGDATGVHLHFEVWSQIVFDSASKQFLLPSNGVRLDPYYGPTSKGQCVNGSGAAVSCGSSSLWTSQMETTGGKVSTTCH
jgi:murein DD-endopeptidase MepM/ murein hydrolase activator NlpD